ncbi:rod shape-determining protein MreC [Massilia agilis]|uniref:Cell shape-determining protein MreC n=1 Tax=Massilia agilis TaxID=1811226 RepID=A0ABT2DHG8_9BURK|nr:rod shape-determining protein MreC [Massilia agilis]MCS0810740.1 rod shape-determining protein MreC [Massilia agilis]
MEYSPPPLFKQGAPARVKVTVFALISIALLVIDARLHALTAVRQVAATVLYPFQMVALMPRDALTSMGDYFSSLSSLQKEVAELKSQQVATSQALQQAQLQMAENAHLRKLMDAREHLPVHSMMSEILYDARDPAVHKVVLDRGMKNGVTLGLPVIDHAGVVGQVTRVFPFTSEVTLLTDKEQAIPVQVLRSGLRSVAYGRGQSGLLDLRFVAPNADIQVGDVLVTSGLDGMYPAGLAVAKVIQVESVGQGAFGRVVCQPLAGIDRNRQLLIVMSSEAKPPRPAGEAGKTVALNKKNLPAMDPVPLPPLPSAPLPAQQPSGTAPAAGAAQAPGAAVQGAPAATGAAQHPPAATNVVPQAAASPRGAAGTPAQTPAAATSAQRAPSPATVPAAGGAAQRAAPAAATPAQAAAAQKPSQPARAGATTAAAAVPQQAQRKEGA